MDLLLKNYQVCLEQRLGIWFADESCLSRTTPLEFRVTRPGYSALLTFEPERCRWQLSTVEGYQQFGSFDKMSKRMRQYFSGISIV